MLLKGSTRGRTKLKTSGLKKCCLAVQSLPANSTKLEVASMPGLLPNELWLLIFDHGEQKDLLQLSLVCKHLHQVVEPYLYREFNWIPAPDIPLPPRVGMPFQPALSDEEQEKRRRFRPAPALLLRTLREHPAIARHLKHVKMLTVHPDIGLSWEENDINHYCKVQHGEPNWADFKAALKRGELPKMGATWNERARLEVSSCTLLSYFCDLSSLEIRVRGFRTTDSFILFILRCLQVRQLTKSVAVTLDNSIEPDWKSRTSPTNRYQLDKHLPSIIFLSQLEELSMSHLNDGVLSLRLDRLDHSSSSMGSSIKRLKLPQCRLSIEVLRKLLSHTPCLEELECDLQYNFPKRREFCSGIDLQEALSMVSKTLRCLKSVFLFVVDMSFLVSASNR